MATKLKVRINSLKQNTLLLHLRKHRKYILLILVGHVYLIFVQCIVMCLFILFAWEAFNKHSPEFGLLTLLTLNIQSSITKLVNFEPKRHKGIFLEESDAPYLFQLVKETSENMGVRMPDKIQIIMFPSLYLFYMPRRLGHFIRREKCLNIGLQYLFCVSVEVFRNNLYYVLSGERSLSWRIISHSAESHNLWAHIVNTTKDNKKSIIWHQIFYQFYLRYQKVFNAEFNKTLEEAYFDTDVIIQSQLGSEAARSCLVLSDIRRMYILKYEQKVLNELAGKYAVLPRDGFQLMAQHCREGLSEAELMQSIQSLINGNNHFKRPRPSTLSRLKRMDVSTSETSNDITSSIIQSLRKKGVSEVSLKLLAGTHIGQRLNKNA